jgi:hypothetical protein
MRCGSAGARNGSMIWCARLYESWGPSRTPNASVSKALRIVMLACNPVGVD